MRIRFTVKDDPCEQSVDEDCDIFHSAALVGGANSKSPFCSYKTASGEKEQLLLNSTLNLGSTLSIVLPGEGEPHDHSWPFRDIEPAEAPAQSSALSSIQGQCPLPPSHKGMPYPSPKRNVIQNYLYSKSALLKYKFIS